MEFTREIREEIEYLKRKNDAVILAHNYQVPEIQEAADFTGDSLALARKAAGVPNKVIVLCGVYFMAETAAILNPDKKVLIPDVNAGCPLACFADAPKVKEWRDLYPDYTFVAYVNSSAEVKALVDICCTSSNAVNIVKSLPNNRIVFLPDKNLGAYVRKQVPEKEIVLWPGFCVVHENADMGSVVSAKEKHPGALVIAHPECRPEMLELADGILSTGQMFSFIESRPEVKEFIIVTEWGIHHGLKKRFPDRIFYEPETRMECKNMKKITLEKLVHTLRYGTTEVRVDPETAGKARLSIEKMLSYS